MLTATATIRRVVSNHAMTARLSSHNTNIRRSSLVRLFSAAKPATDAKADRDGPFKKKKEEEQPSSSASLATPTPTAPASTSSSTTSKKDDNSNSKKKALDDLPIVFADISRAEVAIRGGVKRTTCEKSHFISELVGANVYFKNEFRQFTGSFKERGARNAILQLMRTKKAGLRGVIAASAGNHALALAYHGKELGVPVTVVSK